MVDQELEELELALGELGLATVVADHAAVGVEPQALQFPHRWYQRSRRAW